MIWASKNSHSQHILYIFFVIFVQKVLCFQQQTVKAPQCERRFLHSCTCDSSLRSRIGFGQHFSHPAVTYMFVGATSFYTAVTVPFLAAWKHGVWWEKVFCSKSGIPNATHNGIQGHGLERVLKTGTGLQSHGLPQCLSVHAQSWLHEHLKTVGSLSHEMARVSHPLVAPSGKNSSSINV